MRDSSMFTDTHTSPSSNHFKCEEVLVSALYMNPVMINLALSIPLMVNGGDNTLLLEILKHLSKFFFNILGWVVSFCLIAALDDFIFSQMSCQVDLILLG